jgi:hypothetical protein
MRSWVAATNGNGNGNAEEHSLRPDQGRRKPGGRIAITTSLLQTSYPVCFKRSSQVGAGRAGCGAQPAMQVPVGSTLTLQSLGLGDVAGQVMLQVDKIAIPAMVNDWKPDAVTTTLPMLGLGAPVIADIVIVRADGTVANSIKVELINALPQAQAAGVQPAGFQADQGGAAAALGGL